MPKSRKTRKEKQLTDQRTVTHSFAPKPDLQTKKPEIEHKVTTSEVTPTTTHVPQNRSSIITSDYHYLSGDLLKTTILTVSIVIIELIIKQFARI